MNRLYNDQVKMAREVVNSFTYTAKKSRKGWKVTIGKGKGDNEVIEFAYSDKDDALNDAYAMMLARVRGMM